MEQQVDKGDRKYPRVRTEVIFSVSRVDAEEALGYAVDLSLGGIRFQCVGLDFKVGEVLRVALNLTGEELSVVGKLVRIHSLDPFTQELALSFLEVDSATLERLEGALENIDDSEAPLTDPLPGR